MVQNGFPIEAILGEDIVKKGMTEQQISLFATALETVSTRNINDQTVSFASVMGGKDSSKTVQKIMAEKENVLFKFLINSED